MARLKQNARKSTGGKAPRAQWAVGHGPGGRKLAPVASRASAAAATWPREPAADEEAPRAPGLLLGFPLTLAGNVPGRASSDMRAPAALVRLSLDDVNKDFGRTSSLGGASPLLLSALAARALAGAQTMR